MELDFLKTFVYTKNVDYVKLKFNSVVYPIYRGAGGGTAIYGLYRYVPL